MATTLSETAPAPPPYSRAAPLPQRPTPQITIILLGSPGVGKSTFLSALPRVRDGRLQHNDQMTGDGSSHPPSIPALHPARTAVPNPSSFAVSLFNRPYDIVIHRSESTLFIDPFPSTVDFAILCYSVESRESLYNCQYYWRKQFAERYERDLGLTVPVMLIGLKRDLRTDEKRVVDGPAAVADIGGNDRGSTQSPAPERSEQFVCVMPEEGVKAAQQMRCDRYAECSAVTGELMWEVLEDLTRTAALTTTSKGGLSQGGCVVM